MDTIHLPNLEVHMNTWRRMASLTLWIVSIIAASYWGAASAQSNQQRPPQAQPQSQDATVITGSDLGFMLFPGTLEQGRPAGVLVIRQQGRWVEAELAKQVSPTPPGGRVVPLH